MLGLPCNRWANVCSGEQVWRQGRCWNVSRKAKLPEVSIAAMWVNHINSQTRAGQKTSFKSKLLTVQKSSLPNSKRAQLKIVGCFWQDEVVLLLLVFMCVHTRRPEVNFWWLLLLPSTFFWGTELLGCTHLHFLVPGRYTGCHMSCPYVCLASTFPRPCDVPSLRDCWLLTLFMFPRFHALSRGH